MWPMLSVAARAWIAFITAAVVVISERQSRAWRVKYNVTCNAAFEFKNNI